MNAERRPSSALWILPILALAAGAAGYFLLWLPYNARRQRPENERSADAAIHYIARAEREFRDTDADGNGIPDFWTGDVAGLYVHGKLIDHGIAQADPRPLLPLSMLRHTYHGSLFVDMEFDDSVSPPEPYRQTTDPASGRVQHRAKIAFCAYPAEYGVTGCATCSSSIRS